MSIVHDILRVLARGYGDYSGLRHNLTYRSKEQIKESTLRATLHRLRKRGIIKRKDNSWELTPEGRELLSEGNRSIKRFFPRNPPATKRSRSVLVMFDIPDRFKYKREWLRSELVGFGYKPIQKSVWFGPPLPTAFISYLTEIELLEYLKMFKVSEKLLS